MATFNNSRLFDKKVICPYNNAHVLTVLTINKHLLRCEKNYPNMRLAKCPFNSSHRMQQEKLNEHIIDCDDRDMIDSQLIESKDDNRIKGNLAVPAYNESLRQDVNYVASDDWDDDIRTDGRPGYDPSKNINRNVKFMNVNAIGLKTRKERLGMYQELHKFKGDGKDTNPQGSAQTMYDLATQPQQPRSNVNKAMEVKKNEAASKPIRKPFQESMAEQIGRNNSAGIGRSKNLMARCGANFGESNSVSAAEAPFKQVVGVKPNECYDENRFVIGRGRAILAHKSRPNTKVSAPPGFKELDPSNSKNTNGYLQPLVEGQVEDVTNELRPEKQKRKLEKKLKQIKALLAKKIDGADLSLEEESKVDKLEEVEQQLNKLNLS